MRNRGKQKKEKRKIHTQWGHYTVPPPRCGKTLFCERMKEMNPDVAIAKSNQDCSGKTPFLYEKFCEYLRESEKKTHQKGEEATRK